MEMSSVITRNITNDSSVNDIEVVLSDGAPQPNSYINTGQKFAADIGMAIVTSGNKTDGSTNPSLKSPAKKNLESSSDLPVIFNKSRNKRFHKLFKSAPVEEYPIESFSCAFKGDILLHGQLYVSHNWLCFYSKIKARGRCIEIPFDKIISITREKLALFIPNAIGIQMADHKYVFGSFISRDSTYKKLISLWKLNKEMMLGSESLLLPGDVLSHQDCEASSETDTTEDDVDGGDHLSRILSHKIEVDTIKTQEPVVVIKQLSSENQPCVSCVTILNTFYSLSLKLQRIPRTNMLLGVCTILVFFLLLSAMGLTYKILLLQSKLEMKLVWTSQASVNIRERALSNLYLLQMESHASVVRHLHAVLQANVHLLEEVHLLLKSLHRSPNSCTANNSKGTRC